MSVDTTQSPKMNLIRYEDENGVLIYEVTVDSIIVHLIEVREKGMGQGTKLLTYIDNRAYELGIEKITFLNLSKEDTEYLPKKDTKNLSDTNMFL